MLEERSNGVSNNTSEIDVIERISICNVKGLELLVDQLPEDQKTSIKLTGLEIKRLISEIDAHLYYGPAASLPMICQGPLCPIGHSCMLQGIRKAPIGAKCPIELTMINKWKDDYLSALGASWDDKIERQAIMDLVETEVLRSRANGIIAKEGFIMENTIGINPDTGDPITSKQKHIAMEVNDQVARRQERLLKSLAATREIKEKLGKGSKDQSRKEADLIERVRKVKEREKGVVHDAEIVQSSEKDD